MPNPPHGQSHSPHFAAGSALLQKRPVHRSPFWQRSPPRPPMRRNSFLNHPAVPAHARLHYRSQPDLQVRQSLSLPPPLFPSPLLSRFLLASANFASRSATRRLKLFSGNSPALSGSPASRPVKNSMAWLILEIG